MHGKQQKPSIIMALPEKEAILRHVCKDKKKKKWNVLSLCNPETRFESLNV